LTVLSEHRHLNHTDPLLDQVDIFRIQFDTEMALDAVVAQAPVRRTGNARLHVLVRYLGPCRRVQDAALYYLVSHALIYDHEGREVKQILNIYYIYFGKCLLLLKI